MHLRTVKMVACPLYVPDKDGIVYTQKNMQPFLTNISTSIASSRAFGEIQPKDYSIHVTKISHLIKNIWFEAYNLMCELDILNTLEGKTLDILINDGINLICRPRFIKSCGVVKGIVTLDIYLKDEDIFDITSIRVYRKLKLEKIINNNDSNK